MQGGFEAVVNPVHHLSGLDWGLHALRKSPVTGLSRAETPHAHQCELVTGGFQP
jgi:hypothetical protein